MQALDRDSGGMHERLHRAASPEIGAGLSADHFARDASRTDEHVHLCEQVPVEDTNENTIVRGFVPRIEMDSVAVALYLRVPLASIDATIELHIAELH